MYIYIYIEYCQLILSTYTVKYKEQILPNWKFPSDNLKKMSDWLLKVNNDNIE